MDGIAGHPVIQRDTADFQALCNDLSHFEALVSYLTDPLKWTHLNKQHFSDIADKLLGTQSAFDNVLVYPRSTIYMFACLMRYFFTAKPTDVHDLLIDLNERVESWKALDTVQCLVEHPSTKHYLQNTVKSCIRLGAHPSNPYSQEIFDRLVAIDTIAVDAHLLLVLQNRRDYQRLVTRRGRDAQSLLNILQAILELPLDKFLKLYPTGALIRLSRTSGLFPECMALEGVEFVGEAITGGGFADVWKGWLRGRAICIKVLKGFAKSNEIRFLKEFSSEAVIWRQLHHPNILPFYGVYRTLGRLCFALPWMENGNIVHFLKSAPETNCLPLALDVAQGLHYLHSFRPNIIHGDLKGLNIFITPSGRACIADFGLAMVANDLSVETSTMTRVTGTLRWQAPELLDPDADDSTCAISLASDVYAYACVCYEMFSGDIPFHEMKNDFQVMTAVMRGTRPSRPSSDTCLIRGLDDELWSLIELCWTQEPNNRPAAHQIVERLSSLPTCTVDSRPIEEFDQFSLRSSNSQANTPFIHTAKLPVLKVCLDDALISFKTVVSPWKYPTEWLRANADNVNYIVQDIIALTNSAGLEQTASSVQDLIYPRLIVYVYAHLALCTNEERLVDEFKQTLHQWNTWDIITMLQNHQTIKESVRDLFHQIQGLSVSHSEGVFRKILAWDVIGLCAHLAVVVTDDYKFKDLIAQRGPGAQSLLGLLQTRLDFTIDPTYKPPHVKAMKKLSRASGLKLNRVHIELEQEPVARGGFGDVYKGLMNGKKLAVKVLRIYRDSDLIKLLKEFSSEAILWRQLSHPNILPFYGIYNLPGTIPKIGLMSPWMENGNVVEYLQKHADTDCVHVVFDIAQGLEYLHGHGVVHGDLKGLNVLITDAGTACLADFGLAVAKSSRTIVMSNSLSSKTGGGTMRWQAPELLDDGSEDTEDNRPNTQASDIYAFACVCYEIFSGKVPFYETQSKYRVMLGVVQGRRPTRPSHDLCQSRGLNDEIWHIIETCWNQDPKSRPVSTEVVNHLRVLSDKLVDRRQVGDFDALFLSQEIHTQADNPFSVLADTVIEGAE